MKLSVSVRVAEKFDNKREASMSLESLSRLAADNGYDAICMRASQAGTHTPIEVVKGQREHLDQLGLKVSMVTGDFPIPENDAQGPQALRNITPYLDLAEGLGADLLRIAMKKERDISWAQRASDVAWERRMRLAHQCHTLSLFERPDGSLDVIRRVDRPNFGIIYEPANLELCGQEYGPETIKAFGPHLFNVYIQNQLIHSGGADQADTWSRGPVRFDQIPIWDDRGIDFPMIFETIEQLGYDGYVTVHQAFAGLSGPEEAIRRSAQYLRSLLQS